MKIKAIVHPGEDSGYWAEVPSLPGCVTQGETMEELEANLREAIEGWLLAGEPDGTQVLDVETQILELAI